MCSQTGQPSGGIANQISEENDTCSVCLNDLLDAKKELCCTHEFHQDCITDWFDKKKNCPVCRFEHGSCGCDNEDEILDPYYKAAKALLLNDFQTYFVRKWLNPPQDNSRETKFKISWNYAIGLISSTVQLPSNLKADIKRFLPNPIIDCKDNLIEIMSKKYLHGNYWTTQEARNIFIDAWRKGKRFSIPDNSERNQIEIDSLLMLKTINSLYAFNRNRFWAVFYLFFSSASGSGTYLVTAGICPQIYLFPSQVYLGLGVLLSTCLLLVFLYYARMSKSGWGRETTKYRAYGNPKVMATKLAVLYGIFSKYCYSNSAISNDLILAEQDNIVPLDF